MKLSIRSFDNIVPQYEIFLTKEESLKIKQALIDGADFIAIGDQVINRRYIIGIFEGGEPPIGPERQIEARPEAPDFDKIHHILKEMKRNLKDKGIIDESQDT